MEQIDLDALQQLLKLLCQGDVVDVAKTVRLYSPDAPSYPEEVAGIPREEPVMTMENRLPSGLSVIISQDCDLRRMPDLEPFMLLAPLTTVGEQTYAEAADGMSIRYFAYPPVEGHQDKERLVVDMRVVCSLEKTALLSPHIARIDCPLSAARRQSLRLWLGDRFAREAFPDDIGRQVITPIEQAIKRVREKPDFAGVWTSLVWVGLDWTPGKSYVSLLLLSDTARREASGIGAQQLDVAKKRLQKALNHFAGKGDYTVIANIHDTDSVSAVEVLSHAELPLDLEPVDVSVVISGETGATEPHAAATPT